MYTTGEMAKACGITVRAVQYYDNREILVPSQLSEGGRRLYSDEDLRRLKIICFLRELGLPIESIRQLMQEAHPENVIGLLLEEQQKALASEIDERQSRLQRLQGLQSELKRIDHFTIDSIGDIAHIMENKAKLRRTRAVMLAVGLLMDAMEAAGLTLWIVKGFWQPYVIGLIPVIALGIWVSSYYFKRTAYLCPECHTVFKPRFSQVFWARHTLSARKLTCTGCGHRGFCIETYGKEHCHAHS